MAVHFAREILTNARHQKKHFWGKRQGFKMRSIILAMLHAAIANANATATATALGCCIKLMTKEYLLSYVNNVTRTIANGDISTAILLHFDLMMENYQRRPLFYKHLLKYDRFMVGISLLSFSFKRPQIPLSRVKDFCQARGYMSCNSLDSFFSLLESTGYMEIFSHEEDGRQRMHRPTSASLCENKIIVNAFLRPTDAMFDRRLGTANDAETTDQVEYFSKGLVRILESNIMLDQQLPEAKWIMNRDGGHLPMLALYVDNLRNKSATSDVKVATYSDMSSRLGVSHTHIIRMIKEGESLGYFKRYKHQVHFKPAFIELVENVMSRYFAIARVSMEIGLAYSDSKHRHATD